ncbi:MAG: TRAP transporter substrate-binding protein [Silicimonas sp.]|uniref:TRAP transporter substrate-binding protein n=1 Tax=Roseovarius sp. TaxID=1486281 RepID=UPI0032EE983A
MINRRTFTRSIAAAGMAVACAFSATAQENLTIRVEHDAPATSLTHRLLAELASSLASETEGRINLELHAGASLSGGKIGTMVQNAQAGNVDLAFISSAFYTNIDPRLNLLSLPFMNGSIDDLDYLAGESGVLDHVYSDQEKRNLVVVDTWSRALRQIVNNERVVETPDDMQGLRFRVPEIKLWADTFKALGAVPVPMPFSEVVTALELGAIEGAERPTEFLKTEAWWDMAQYVSMVNYTGDVLMVSFNRQFWERLEQSDQELLTEKLKKLGDETFEAEKSMEDSVIATLRENGMVVTQLTSDQVDAFREHMRPVWADYESQIGADLIAAAQSALTDR